MWADAKNILKQFHFSADTLYTGRQLGRLPSEYSADATDGIYTGKGLLRIDTIFL